MARFHLSMGYYVGLYGNAGKANVEKDEIDIPRRFGCLSFRGIVTKNGIEAFASVSFFFSCCDWVVSP